MDNKSVCLVFTLLMGGYVFGMDNPDPNTKRILDRLKDEYDDYNAILEAVRSELWDCKDASERGILEERARRRDLSFESFLKIRQAAPVVLAQAKRDGLI